MGTTNRSHARWTMVESLAVLHARNVEGHTIGEIAQATRRSPGAIYHQLHLMKEERDIRKKAEQEIKILERDIKILNHLKDTKW